jgi:hypothetical protein
MSIPKMRSGLLLLFNLFSCQRVKIDEVKSYTHIERLLISVGNALTAGFRANDAIDAFL